jgi:hypothetical protein
MVVAIVIVGARVGASYYLRKRDRIAAGGANSG